MKVLSFSSKEVNNRLLSNGVEVEKLWEFGLIETIYNKHEINNSLKVENNISTIDEIKTNCDVVVFDFLCLLKNHYELNKKIFNEGTLREFYTKEKIDSLESKKIKGGIIDIFKESFKVIINRVTREYHPSKIVLLKVLFNEGEEDVSNKNNILNSVYLEAEKILPMAIAIDINIDSISKITDIELEKLIEENTVLSEIFKNEKVHTSINNIRYVYKKAKINNSKKLIIIFSSFSSDIPKYNYITFFKTIDCNKLFILDDFGERGSYYLGIDGGLEIETSVMSLIASIMSRNNILFKDVISVGSSKGGSAALYYGFKYGFGNIIVGAPQYKIGTYLSDLSIKQYAKDIFKNINYATRIKYDNIIRLVLTNKNNTKARILTSDGDKQYENVLKSLEYESLVKNYDISFEKCNINNHGEIAKVYPEYLLNALNELLEGKGIYSKIPMFNIVKKLVKGEKNNEKN